MQLEKQNRLQELLKNQFTLSVFLVDGIVSLSFFFDQESISGSPGTFFFAFLGTMCEIGSVSSPTSRFKFKT